jgi:hypothetical protein
MRDTKCNVGTCRTLLLKRNYPRIRVGSIAAVLSTLVALAAQHRTQAHSAPHVSSIFPSASARMPSKLAGTKEDLGDLFYVEGRDMGGQPAPVGQIVRVVGSTRIVLNSLRPSGNGSLSVPCTA